MADDEVPRVQSEQEDETPVTWKDLVSENKIQLVQQFSHNQ